MTRKRQNQGLCSHWRGGVTAFATLLAGLTAGCSNTSGTRPMTFDGSAGSDGSDDGAGLAAPARTGRAAVNNDTRLQATSGSILDPNRGVVHTHWVGSNPPHRRALTVNSPGLANPAE